MAYYLVKAKFHKDLPGVAANGPVMGALPV